MEISRHTLGHEDSRGMILDILQNEQISAVTLVTFKEGAVRGNHFHEKTTQWNYIQDGEIEFRIKNQEVVSKGILRQGDLLRIDPNEIHAMKAKSESVIYVFTLGPRGGKEYETDTFRVEEKILW
jgi:quercetin dioxygenase-like cupin family protein